MFASVDSCLKIPTMGTCILCLDPESPNNLDNVNTRSYTNRGFSQFLRYLKINNKDLLSHPSFTFKPMETDNEANVEVSLCSSCVSVTDEFERLYSSYELIKLQIDDCVMTIHQSLRSGNDCPQRSEQFQVQMKPQCFSDMINYSVVSNLRSITLDKCLRELQVYDLPQNEIVVKNEMMISSYTEPKSFKTSSDTDDSSTYSSDSDDEQKYVPLPKVTNAKPKLQKKIKNEKAKPIKQTKIQNIVLKKEEETNQNNVDKKRPNYFGKKQQKRFEIKEEKKIIGKRQPSRNAKKEITTKPNPSRKRFECRTCHRVFSMKINLVRHTNAHKKDKLRKKQSPSKRSWTKKGKNVDVNNSGTSSGDKQQHLCEICGKPFANFHNIKVHMRIHTGDRPFKCSRCPMSFAQKAHLEKHERSREKTKLFKCSKCPLKFCLRRNVKCHEYDSHT